MKKCILAVMAVIGCVTFSVASSNSEVVLNSQSVVMSKSRTVVVYKINASGVVIKAKTSGTFDEENMILTLSNGTTVGVTMNADKGRGRDNYTYKGGSCYYFD